MNRYRKWSMAVVVALMTASVWAGEIPEVAPDKIGLSADRLERIGALMEKYVEDKQIPGAVALIARHGKIGYFETFGHQDMKTQTPMEKDSIFRIYSMSKPMTSVGVMMLYEKALFALNDPVSKYLPELGDLEVMAEETNPKTGETVMTTVKTRRDMTIRDLLRHTSGLTYGFFGDTLVDRAYRGQGVLSADKTIEETVRKLGDIPLQYQPGTRWHYSVSTDVLGRLIEVVSGMAFDEYLEKNLFGPLGMKDSGFNIPPSKSDRLTSMYAPDDDGSVRSGRAARARDYLQTTTHFSGGGGLVSTTRDYLRFAQMLLNGGELDGVRILSRKTVELMSRNHLGEISMGMGMSGYGFGLGFAVNQDPGLVGAIGSAGEYNWGGAAGTRFWIDPQEELIGIFMVQILPHNGLTYGSEYKVLVYQAIDD